MLQPAVADPRTGDETFNAVVDADTLAGDIEPGPEVCRYVDRLHALVRWFAMQYPSEPEWHFQNQFGQPLPAAEELAATYRGVIG